jgi:hypothetical protein
MLGIMMSSQQKKAATPVFGVRSINTAKSVRLSDVAIYPPNALYRPIKQDSLQNIAEKRLRDPLVPPASN